jgi:hypothetical protein
MRVLIYGGRDFTNRQGAFAFLDGAFDEEPQGTLMIVSGKARGADTIAEEWADERGHGFEGYAADWARHGKSAGSIRNQQMLDTGIDLAVQFPGGSGTADMRRRLDNASVRVLEY